MIFSTLLTFTSPKAKDRLQACSQALLPYLLARRSKAWPCLSLAQGKSPLSSSCMNVPVLGPWRCAALINRFGSRMAYDAFSAG